MYVRLWIKTFNEICGGSPQSFEPWISGWILSDLSNFPPPHPRDRAEAIVLADAFFVVSSLPPPTSPAGLPLPCLPLHQAPRTIRKCQFLSQQRNSAGGRAGCCGTVFEKGEEEELEPFIK